jgi:hypothetical protein
LIFLDHDNLIVRNAFRPAVRAGNSVRTYIVAWMCAVTRPNFSQAMKYERLDLQGDAANPWSFGILGKKTSGFLTLQRRRFQMVL